MHYTCARRDILWRIVSSKYFSIAILIGMTLIAYNRCVGVRAACHLLSRC